VARIRNDDTEISIGNRQRTEGDTGEAEAVFVVQLSDPSALEVTVDYATSNGTASAGEDYEPASGTLVFAPGEVAKAFSVPVLGDRRVESNETFSVNLSDAINASFANNEATGTIVNDDGDVEAFLVTQLTPTASGFVAQLNRDFDPANLNLYDVEAGTYGPADVILAGNSSGPVNGSLILGSDRLTFVADNGVLPADTYTATLRSAVDGFKDLAAGKLLDGDGDGTAGGDYQFTFTAGAPEPVVVSISDFARGPNQPADVPADQAGLPIRVSDGSGVAAIDLTLRYDPALLSVTDVVLGADAPGDATVARNLSTPGTIGVTFAASSGLGSGPASFVNLVATVPSAAPYGAAHVLEISNVSVNGGGMPATTDSAVHAVAFVGDATGNETYSGLDAQRVARVAVGLDTGFAAYPLISPVVISDVTGDGALSGLDAQRIAQETVGLNPDEIPRLSQPLRLDQFPDVGSETSPLTRSQFEPILAASLDRIAAVENEDSAGLLDVEFEIVDLPGGLLGLTRGRTIQIDVNAAGYGWFIDTTPWDDVEFVRPGGNNELTALPGTLASDRADLLTVVLHELGHVLGHGHEDQGLMDDTLPLATRRLPLGDFDGVLDGDGLGTGAVDQAFATFGS
jgi:hypothetical protein